MLHIIKYFNYNMNKNLNRIMCMNDCNPFESVHVGYCSDNCELENILLIILATFESNEKQAPPFKVSEL